MDEGIQSIARSAAYGALLLIGAACTAALKHPSPEYALREDCALCKEVLEEEALIGPRTIHVSPWGGGVLMETRLKYLDMVPVYRAVQGKVDAFWRAPPGPGQVPVRIHRWRQVQERG